jgi:CrcB protein
MLAAIALGGALGAPSRYGVAQLIGAGAGGFPWSTFVINLTGSFALGVLVVLLLDRLPAMPQLRPFLTTGFLGAYTTYSTFAVETDLLIVDGHAGTAVAYVVASFLGGFAAAWSGVAVGRSLQRRGEREVATTGSER